MKFSVITITYNSEKTIEDTIKSIISQNYDDYEYIIIDGGSTDGTLSIVNKYKDNITKIISEKDEGISDAFNKGIMCSVGEIISIINSDDLMMPGALRKVSEEISPKTDVFYGNTIMFGEDRATSVSVPLPLEKFKLDMAVLHPACFIRKSAYDKFGLYKLKYKSSMDRELLMRMYYGKAAFQYCDFEFAKFRTGDGMSSRQYFEVALPENEEISMMYGAKKIECRIHRIKCGIRFALAEFLRKIGIGEYIRRFVHSKSTRL